MAGEGGRWTLAPLRDITSTLTTSSMSASSRIVGVSDLTGLALDTLFVCRVACFCFFLFQLLVYSLP